MKDEEVLSKERLCVWCPCRTELVLIPATPTPTLAPAVAKGDSSSPETMARVFVSRKAQAGFSTGGGDEPGERTRLRLRVDEMELLAERMESKGPECSGGVVALAPPLPLPLLLMPLLDDEPEDGVGAGPFKGLPSVMLNPDFLWWLEEPPLLPLLQLPPLLLVVLAQLFTPSRPCSAEAQGLSPRLHGLALSGLELSCPWTCVEAGVWRCSSVWSMMDRFCSTECTSATVVATEAVVGADRLWRRWCSPSTGEPPPDTAALLFPLPLRLGARA